MAAEVPPLLKASIDATKATYKQLGKSGLRVSVPVFGAMSFGTSKWGAWVIDEDKVSPLPSYGLRRWPWRTTVVVGFGSFD